MEKIKFHARYIPSIDKFEVNVFLAGQQCRSTMDYESFKNFVINFRENPEVGGMRLDFEGTGAEEATNEIREYLLKVLVSFEASEHFKGQEPT